MPQNTRVSGDGIVRVGISWNFYTEEGVQLVLVWLTESLQRITVYPRLVVLTYPGSLLGEDGILGSVWILPVEVVAVTFKQTYTEGAIGTIIYVKLLGDRRSLFRGN